MKNMKKNLAKYRQSFKAVSWSMVTVDNVTVSIEPPSEDVKRANIIAGQNALARSREAFLKKGIHIEVIKGVPLYRANASEPSFLIRNLDGVEEQGTFENGQFKLST
jgi:hypothetical protein